MNAVDLIKEFEGLRLDAYKDQAGVWTIGYGHTGDDVKPGLSISKQRAEDLLREDMSWASRAVAQTVEVPINPEQRAAITSLVYNIGSGAWKNSTALRRLNAGDYAGAAEAMTWWNKVTVDGKKKVSNGLVRRREKERNIFMSNVPVGEDVEVAGPVTGGEQKDLSKGESTTMNTALMGELATGGAAVASAFAGMDWRTALALVAIGGLFAYLAYNRWMEAKTGEH